MMMGPCHSDEPRPPTWMNWGYETGAAYGQPASEGYGRAASGQLRSGGGGVFDEFGQPVDLNALAMAIERARDADDKAD